MRTHVDEESVDLLLPAFHKLITIVLDDFRGLVPSLFLFLRCEVIVTLVPAALYELMGHLDEHK